MNLNLLDREVKVLAEKYGADSYSVEEKTHLKNNIYTNATAWVMIDDEMIAVCVFKGADNDNYNEEYLLFVLEEKIKTKLKDVA